MNCACIAAVATLASAAAASGQWYWPPTEGVGVSPECPAPTTELTIRAAGEWPDSCPPNIARVSVDDFEVDLKLVSDPPPGPCPTVITAYSHEVSFGPLAAGEYTVYVSYFVGERQALPRERVASFVVDPACRGCYADCDGSASLDFFDFLCFQNAFAAGEEYADCDESGELDFFDFLCFQDEFGGGCH